MYEQLQFKSFMYTGLFSYVKIGWSVLTVLWLQMYSLHSEYDVQVRK